MEECIILALSSIHELRLVFDRDTGKAKGFGFCEFYGAKLSEHTSLPTLRTKLNLPLPLLFATWAHEPTITLLHVVPRP